ncbi:unnamed protein product, partial [Ectocarpus sp. 12 AP-2014]
DTAIRVSVIGWADGLIGSRARIWQLSGATSSPRGLNSDYPSSRATLTVPAIDGPFSPFLPGGCVLRCCRCCRCCHCEPATGHPSADQRHTGSAPSLRGGQGVRAFR